MRKPALRLRRCKLSSQLTIRGLRCQMRKSPHAAEIPRLSRRKSIQALGAAAFSRSVKACPGRIKMSAERLAMMSADIRSQLLALQRGAPDGASFQISVGYLIYHPDMSAR